jgi:hypothetical protein
MKRLLTGLAVVGVAALVGPALAKAPAEQYAGFDKDSDAIVDQQTKLTWYRKQLRTAASFNPGASTACPSGSRLPALGELLSLVDEDPHTVEESGRPILRSLDPEAFAKLPVDFPYWTQTSVDLVLGVNLSTGETVKRATADATRWYVLCVSD